MATRFSSTIDEKLYGEVIDVIKNGFTTFYKMDSGKKQIYYLINKCKLEVRVVVDPYLNSKLTRLVRKNADGDTIALFQKRKKFPR